MGEPIIDRSRSARPTAITVLSVIYILMGTVGFIYHFRDFGAAGMTTREVVLVEALRVVAIVSGSFMLLGRNWARWLAIAWIALHVAVSFYNGWQQVAMHAIFLVLIAILLTRPAANAYFHPSGQRTN